MKSGAITIAYFSAEIGISSNLPTYSGGLGVLAGDHLRAAADLELPMCAVTLLYKEGYFKQRIDEEGVQTETYPRFDPDPLLEKIPLTLQLPLRGRQVWIHAWKYLHRGATGHEIPIFLLDTDVEENIHEDRIITLRLYSGDKDHRILQEAILGFGGVLLLEQLGLQEIETYHLNEGHCAFLTLRLLERYGNRVEDVRKRCIFTTHTPVPAGHDHFSIKRCERLLDSMVPKTLPLPNLVRNSRLHMTELALYLSRAVNGVSRLHREVAQKMFPQFEIGYVTNGVQHSRWIGKAFRELFDQVLPGWRTDPERLLEIDTIPDEDLRAAHDSQKHFLLGYANSQTQKALSMEVLTIGFARRAAGYKRANLIFTDLKRLVELGQKRIQIIFAGKAHPRDENGKKILHEIVQNANRLFGKVKIIFLENYNIWLGRLITSGVDVWLNTPVRFKEASGTSGMKAALNGIPSLSVRDGWWAEGCREGINGWSFGDNDFLDDQQDAEELYQLLESKVIPTYYDHPEKWMTLMRESIKTGVRFTACRMVEEYNALYYQQDNLRGSTKEGGR